MKLISLAFVFFAVALSNCEEQEHSSEITKIEFGTSFGMCMGYCTQVLTLSEGLAEKTVTPRGGENQQAKTCAKNFDGFSSLASKIDAEGFLALDEQIGCPDCADGGAEWIEVTTPEGSKRVVYEYGKEPREVLGIINQLRDQYDALGTCE